MEKLLNEIKNYMDFLEEDFGLDISVCDTHEKLFPYMMQIAPYNSHKNFTAPTSKKNTNCSGNVYGCSSWCEQS